MNYRVTRPAIGKPTVHYPCPTCAVALHSPLTQAGSPETCPECNTEFAVPGVVELTEERKRIEAQTTAEKAEAAQKAVNLARAEARARAISEEAIKKAAAQRPGKALIRSGFLLEIFGIVVVVIGFGSPVSVGLGETVNLDLLFARLGTTVIGCSLFVSGAVHYAAGVLRQRQNP